MTRGSQKGCRGATGVLQRRLQRARRGLQGGGLQGVTQGLQRGYIRDIKGMLGDTINDCLIPSSRFRRLQGLQGDYKGATGGLQRGYSRFQWGYRGFNGATGVSKIQRGSSGFKRG